MTLRFRDTDADTEGSCPDVLGIASQTADGRWRRLRLSAVDKGARTVTGSLDHFSDWSLVQWFQLRPASATVVVGRSLDLRIRYCYDERPDDPDEAVYRG